MAAARRRFGGASKDSESFSTAGRSIKAGLTACDIVAKWTWAATLLQSSNVAYQYGISGPFWYASGASIQILLFAVLAVEIKRRELPISHSHSDDLSKSPHHLQAALIFTLCLS